jgi:DNA-binding NtrC family response regulator
MSGARLLIVDDEPVLADLLKRYLERLGYEVDTCNSAEQALPLFAARPDRYSLVLADLTLPGMNGEEMIDRMLAQNTELKAIVSSGYPHQPRSKQVGFLQKPFVPKMLADLIEKKLRP